MNRDEWGSWTDKEAIKRRAGGRRRYDAQRRRRLEARRDAVAEVVSRCVILPRGALTTLAWRFGVSPATISRDLRLILYGGQRYDYWSGDRFLFSVTREYPGGPVVGVEDPGGNEIRGQARRRRIIRSLPRYFA